MGDEADDSDARAILVSNERIKLRATFLNGLSVAIFAVGGLAPIVTAFTSMTASVERLTVLCLVCLVFSYALHSYAMRSLKGLRV